MKKIVIVLVIAAFVLSLVACGSSHTDSQQAQQKITEAYAQKLDNAVPYPLSQMNYSEERANLRERLLRENDPNKIGYVYIFPPYGSNPVGYYTILGKVSSTNSQMTVTQNIYTCSGQSPRPGQGIACAVTLDSMGDDGSYGPNEGGQSGIFFFTTSGVWVETVLPWVYTDAPLPFSVPSLNPSKKPTSVSKYWCIEHKNSPICKS